MSVTVVIPVYERQCLSARAVRSVLVQDVDDLELVVVDDCSAMPFALPADLASDPRIRVLRHDRNRGAGTSRDTGVAASRGQWIAFLDSDDVWLPGTLRPRLELAEREFAATGDPMIAYAAGFVLDRKSVGRQEARIPIASADPKDFVSTCWFAPGSTALLRREAFTRVGPTDPALRRLEDFDWYIRFALLGGRLRVWPHVAALIEVARKPGVRAAVAVTSHLRAKYADPAGPYRLTPELINQLEACFDVELASSLLGEGRWLPAVLYLCRSFWRVPRTAPHLRRLWSHPSAHRA